MWGDCTPLASSEDFDSVTIWTGRWVTTIPEVEYVRVVQDNLNTHTPGALYEAFAPEGGAADSASLAVSLHTQARQLVEYAEIEIGIFQRSCLRRRLGYKQQLSQQVTASKRSTLGSTVRSPDNSPLGMHGSSSGASIPKANRTDH